MPHTDIRILAGAGQSVRVKIKTSGALLDSLSGQMGLVSESRV